MYVVTLTYDYDVSKNLSAFLSLDEAKEYCEALKKRLADAAQYVHSNMDWTQRAIDICNRAAYVIADELVTGQRWSTVYYANVVDYESFTIAISTSRDRTGEFDRVMQGSGLTESMLEFLAELRLTSGVVKLDVTKCCDPLNVEETSSFMSWRSEATYALNYSEIDILVLGINEDNFKIEDYPFALKASDS